MPNPIIALAPMDGITNNAYRTICSDIFYNKQNSYKDSYNFSLFTEFMSAEGYIRNPEKLTRHLLSTVWQSPLIAQIYWWNHDSLLQTAIDIDIKYPDFTGIELNIGCPSPRIMSCEAGSGMLRCRPQTLTIIKQLSESINRPFSIKTRAWLTLEDKKEQFNFIIESAYCCHMITIHGRTYKQSHSGEVDRDFILNIKEELIRRNLHDVKIIWNWWLKSVDDWLPYLSLLDWIMLGQAAMCSPWALVSYSPSIWEVYDTAMKHLHLSLANEWYFTHTNSFDSINKRLIQPTSEDLDKIIAGIKSNTINPEVFSENGKWYSLIEFRKHLFWYVTGLPGNAEFKRSAATISHYRELIELIDHYFKPLLAWNIG